MRMERLKEVAARAMDESLAECTPDEFLNGFPSLGSGVHCDVLSHVHQQAQAVLRENAMVPALLALLSASPRRARPTMMHRLLILRFRSRCSCRLSLMTSLARWPWALALTGWMHCSLASRSCRMDRACESRIYRSPSLACIPLSRGRQADKLPCARLLSICRPLTSETEAADLIAAASLPSKRKHKAALEDALREIEQENANLQAQYLAAQPALQAASAEIAACKALVEKTATSCEQWRAQNA